MLTRLEKLLAKLFNNPIGRLWLGVPQNKKIYKITKSSVHYLTGEISKKNGMPIICTGKCRPNGRLKFIKFLETWKPIHLCWLFKLMKWRIPKYFVGDYTSLNSPTATGGNEDNWTNPTYAYSSNDQYAETSVGSLPQSYETFGLELPGDMTVNGIEVVCDAKQTGITDPLTIRWWCAYDASWSDIRSHNFGGTETSYTYGSSSDLWDEPAIYSDFSDANFSVQVYPGSGYSASSQTGTYYLDHIQVKVYYTTNENITAIPSAVRITGTGKPITRISSMKPETRIKSINSESRIKSINPESRIKSIKPISR